MIHFNCLPVLVISLLVMPLSAAAQEAPERLPTPALDDAPIVEQLDKASRPISRNSQRISIAPAGLMFASFDSDGDYQITLAETEAGIAAAFNTADRNTNGRLSLVEVDTWRERALGSLDLLPGNTQFDRNFNAIVTRAEFTEVLTRTGNRLDKNEDGFLDFSELLSKPRARKGEKRERSEGQGQRTERPRRR